MVVSAANSACIAEFPRVGFSTAWLFSLSNWERIALRRFPHFGSELDRATQQQLGRGQRLQEILKQPQYAPMSLAEQVMILFAGVNGYLDQVPVEQVQAYEAQFLSYMATQYPDMGHTIMHDKTISQDTEDQLREALVQFNKVWE